jgi:hypothetical protein
VKELQALAIRNNAELCAAVHRAHGHDSVLGPDLWTTAAAPLPFYPNAITLTPGPQTFEAAARFIEASPHESWGIKDSYAALDLTRWRFVPAVSAVWLARLGNAPESPGPKAVPVRDAEALAEWERAWGGDPVFRQFPPSLLTEPGFTFWSFRRRGSVVSGCTTNETGDAVGFSNVFGPNGEASWWHRNLDFLAKAFPGRPLVGWERDPDALAVTPAFRRLGPLTVWIRPPG